MIYKANSKTWIKSDIFIKWLYYLDYYFYTMDQKILLLIDNARFYFNFKQFEQSKEEKSKSEFESE